MLYRILNATRAVITHRAGTVPLTGKQEEPVLRRLLLHKTLLIPSCLGLAGTSAPFCSIAGSSSLPGLSQVPLAGYSCMQRTQPAHLSAPRQAPSCREANALRHCLFSMPPWLDQGEAFQEHHAAAYGVLFPLCLSGDDLKQTGMEKSFHLATSIKPCQEQIIKEPKGQYFLMPQTARQPANALLDC